MSFTDLETERLYLKNISAQDVDFIFRQFSDDAVNRYLFDAEPLSDLAGAQEILDFYLQPEPRPQHRWILVRKADGRKMGTCGFHCWDREKQTVEVGYDLKEEFWGQGYMREAMKAILSFAARHMNVREIRACIYVDNARSLRLAQSLGFVPSGLRYEIFRGKKYPHHQYSLFLTES